MKNFLEKIARFNQMYNLFVHETPTMPSVDALQNFKSIMQEELDELDDIIVKRKQLDEASMTEYGSLYWSILTDLADWHGDMIIYPHTNAHKIGFPMAPVLEVIMESNFSKLDANGNPIYDHRGKVIKGPNFFPPEPRIEIILKSKINDAEGQKAI